MPRPCPPLQRPERHLVVAAWLAALVVLDPRGAFPLNDDWSYAIAVQRLIEGGGFHPTGWTSMPLLTNVLWGALFSGRALSFEALRLSTVVAGAAGGYAASALVTGLGGGRRLAALVQAVFLFCPLTVALSVTFMTDLPYAALELWAVVLLLKYLRDGSERAFWGGAGLALAATLSRQTGLAVPLAFGLVLMAQRGVTFQNAWRAAAPLALSVSGLVGVQRWLSATGRMPEMYAGKVEATAARLLSVSGASQVAGNVHGVLLTAGVLLAPLLIVTGVTLWRRDKARGWWGGAGAAVAALSAARVLGGGPWRLPLLGNTLVDTGIGPLTLVDAFVLDVGVISPLPAAWWAAATAVGTAGAVVLLAALAPLALRRPRTWSGGEAAAAFLVLAAAATLTPLLPGDFFDRYLIATLPLVAGALVALVRPAWPAGGPASGALLVLLALGAFGVTGTHDYLAWNRTRWAVLDQAAREAPEAWARMDGGVEFNGLHRYDPSETRRPGESWWARGGADVVTFGPLPGYTVVQERSYRSWLPPGVRRVYWLRQTEPRQRRPRVSKDRGPK